MSDTPGVKPDQGVAAAAVVDHLNNKRIEELFEALHRQDLRLENALAFIDYTLHTIDEDIIERNRGGQQGMHGFIAEIAQYGVGNARKIVQGLAPDYVWINDNGPADLIRGDILIQQKFYAGNPSRGIQAALEHLQKYPGFIADGGRYQIPRDQYNELIELVKLSPEQAARLVAHEGGPNFKEWQKVNQLLAENPGLLDRLESSDLGYRQAQATTIGETLSEEQEQLHQTDRDIRAELRDEAKPTFAEAGKAAAAGAALEGLSAFIHEILVLRKTGKAISEFTARDWHSIATKSGLGALRGGTRGAILYAATNYLAAPAFIANALLTASFGIAQQAHELRTGTIDSDQLIDNCETLCIEVAVSAVSSLLGQTLIPIPVIGALIGNTIGTVMLRAAQNALSSRELELIKHYRLRQTALNLEYKALLEQLNQAMTRFLALVEAAFSPNMTEALDGSIELAVALGVPTESLLSTADEIDDYFLA